MTSWDYFVGFVRLPEDLDSFLAGEGYDNVSSDDLPDTDYESREGGLVEISFFPEVAKVKPGEIPDWSKSGLDIACDLMVSTKDSEAVERALGLAETIVKRYDAVFYDLDLDEFFRKNEI